MSITTRAPYGFELEYMPLDAFGGTGPHRLTPIAAALSHRTPTLHGGGGGGVFKAVVSVVAAIAIPFVAPVIASSIGLSATIGTAIGSATAGSVIGGALVGAGLGAVKGAVLGEDIGRSALFGGIGGGISGYAGAPTSPTSAAPTATGTGITPTGGQGLTATGGQGLTYTAPTTAGGVAATSAPLTGVGGAFGPVDYSLAAGVPSSYGFTGTGTYGLQAPTSTYDIGAALSSGTPVDYSLAAGMTSPATGLSVTSTAPSGAMQTTTAGGTTTAPTYGTVTAPTTTTAIAPTTTTSYDLITPTAAPAGMTTVEGAGAGIGPESLPQKPLYQQVGGAIADKFKDPKALADLTLRAAGMLAGSAIAGQGLSPEEQAALNAYTEEMRRLQETDRALFNQRLEQAQKLIGESKYFDPEYFGLQRARRTQIAGARAKRAGLRGLEGERREAEARRYDLATARDVGSAFDQGYLTGIQGRLQTQQAGLSALPPSPTSGYASSEYNAITQAYANADRMRRQQQQDIGGLFGSFTGGSSSTSLG